MTPPMAATAPSPRADTSPCADRGDRRFGLYRRILRTTRGRQQTRTTRSRELRPCSRPAPRQGMSPGCAHRLERRCRLSWVASDWQSTLYNHALTPNAAPSCITADRHAAFMGASSGHLDGVNVLLFDGSVRPFSPRVDPKIWREWATVPQSPRNPSEGPLKTNKD